MRIEDRSDINEIKEKLNAAHWAAKLLEALMSVQSENERLVNAASELSDPNSVLDYSQKIEYEMDRVFRLRQEVTEMIDMIPDPDLRAVLYLRYLCGKSTIEIAELMHFGRNTVLRKHKKALLILAGEEKTLDSKN